MTTPVSLDHLTAAAFEARLDDAFRIDRDGGPIVLRLVAVRRLGQTRRAGGGFALDFVTVKGPQLPQAIYHLANETLGTVDIFLVPIGPIEGGFGYEALFA